MIGLSNSNTSDQETYYEILSVKEDASQDEIRASYKIAALSSHPDKLNTKDGKSSRQSLEHERFLKVQKAWEVLSNPNSRSAYDRDLSVSRQDLALANEVRLEEMVRENSKEVLELSYPCRCGDNFVIDSSELEEMGFSLNETEGLYSQGYQSGATSIVIPCYSCSLKIHLII